MMTPREAAYLALIQSHTHQINLIDTLNEWREKDKPAPQDLRLAQEIAYGTMRKQRLMDYYATELSANKKLNLKPKELYLLRSALYQYYEMDKIPLYALANDTVEIAQKYFSKQLANFFNALLRKLPLTEIPLPQDLATLYSYPQPFIDKLLKHFPHETALNILSEGNTSSKTTVRIRDPHFPLDDLELLISKPFIVASVKDSNQIKNLSSSPSVYIQNVTPAYLIGTLAQKSQSQPQTILDLCSSPGGKLIAAHDLHPHAKLFANDVSEIKLNRIRENLSKYNIEAELSCSPGQELQPKEKFSLIIIDAPCSNSGVFNKRPEARWRFTHESLKGLLDLQYSLLSHAKTLLKEGGEVWYLTCSILPEENEKMVEKAVRNLGFTKRFSELILPNEKGWDGGFGAVLTA